MKKSKNFVLAALVLLALTGCKNDTVPEPTRYTVKFETDHGTDPADITVVSGAELTDKDLAIEPEVGDNIFEGWYDGETKAEGGMYTVTKDVTLVAKLRDRGTVASVTFSPAGGTKFYFDESIEVSLTSEDGATIQYHLGDGSWKDYDAGSKVEVTGDTTITAKATEAYQSSTAGYGGLWWLRSPFYNSVDSARIRVTTDYAKATGAVQDSTPGYGGWSCYSLPPE